MLEFNGNNMTLTRGDTIYIDNYIKTIANREFIYSTKQKVVMTKNNETVNLYYGLEGENVYD